jgi:hypothetical protein
LLGTCLKLYIPQMCLQTCTGVQGATYLKAAICNLFYHSTNGIQ